MEKAGVIDVKNPFRTSVLTLLCSAVSMLIFQSHQSQGGIKRFDGSSLLTVTRPLPSVIRDHWAHQLSDCLVLKSKNGF